MKFKLNNCQLVNSISTVSLSHLTPLFFKLADILGEIKLRGFQNDLRNLGL